MSGLAKRSEFLIYQTENGTIKLEVRVDRETVWLTQQQLAELFQTTVPNISMHLSNIFEEGELQLAGTVQNFLTVRQEGTRRVNINLEHYNLDAIISVAYRVEIVATLSQQLSWSHVHALLPIKGPLARAFYAEMCRVERWNVRTLRQKIGLQPEATYKEFLSVRREGKGDVRRSLDFHNLDAIISIGYRVKSRVATQFRNWSTQRLRQYLIKAFVLDHERLKGVEGLRNGLPIRRRAA